MKNGHYIKSDLSAKGMLSGLCIQNKHNNNNMSNIISLLLLINLRRKLPFFPKSKVCRADEKLDYLIVFWQYYILSHRRETQANFLFLCPPPITQLCFKNFERVPSRSKFLGTALRNQDLAPVWKQ